MPTPREKFEKLPEKCRDCPHCILLWDFETSKCRGCARRHVEVMNTNKVKAELDALKKKQKDIKALAEKSKRKFIEKEIKKMTE